MKSTNYSVKGAFSAAFTATARRQLPGALIAAAVSAIVSVIYALFYCTGYYGYDNDISYGVMMWGSAVLFIAAVYSAIGFRCGIFRHCRHYFRCQSGGKSNVYNSNGRSFKAVADAACVSPCRLFRLHDVRRGLRQMAAICCAGVYMHLFRAGTADRHCLQNQFHLGSYGKFV